MCFIKKINVLLLKNTEVKYTTTFDMLNFIVKNYVNSQKNELIIGLFGPNSG